jgi:DNA polymerase I-like protein with 3'-5' exonuclease and polymerase domains
MNFPDLRGHGMISIDCETCDPNISTTGPGYGRDGFIAGISIATEKGFAAYYPVGHEAGGNLPKTKVFNWLKKQLALPVPKVGMNLLYDLGYLEADGIKVAGPFYDIGIAEPLLNENRFSYSLDIIAKHHIKKGKDEDALKAYIIEKFGIRKKTEWKSHIWRVPPDVAAPYAIADVTLPLEVFVKQQQELESQDLWDLFIMESKLIPMLLAMRQRGVKVDLDYAEAMLKEVEILKQKELDEIWKMAKGEVSIWAAEELVPMFDAQGIEYPMTPKTKKPSLTALWLERCEHPVAQRIVSARKMDKLCSVFLRGAILESHINGRVHCSFNQLRSENGGTVSGRFSSSLPNLQQIPTRTDMGKRIRQIFIPDEGQKWWKYDYSQIEYRLMVHDAVSLDLRGAKDVAEAYAKDPKTDFHQVVADMAGIARKDAKTVNFGIAYGEGIPKLIKSLNLTQEQGEAFMKKYHQNAPFMKPLSGNYTMGAGAEGEIRTLMNRKRRFDTWEAMDRKTKTMVYYPHRVPGARRAFTHAALNARIQGSAADIMKKAMVDIWESGVIAELGVPQLTVHDELDGSMPDTKAGRAAFEEVGRIMQNVVKLHVPLLVDGGTGPNWGLIE